MGILSTYTKMFKSRSKLIQYVTIPMVFEMIVAFIYLKHSDSHYRFTLILVCTPLPSDCETISPHTNEMCYSLIDTNVHQTKIISFIIIYICFNKEQIN